MANKKPGAIKAISLNHSGNIEVEHQPTLSTRPAANASTAGNEPENWNRGLKGGIQLQMCG